MNNELGKIPLAVEVKEKKLRQSIAPPADRALLIATCVFSLLGGVLCIGAAMAYARLAPPLLDTMYPTISELTMREAQHLESAHNYSAAFDTYMKALDGRYQGPQNRAFTLYRLGMLQREHGLGEGQPDFLMQAYGHPRCPAAAYEVVARQMLSEYAPEKENALKELFERWEEAVVTPETMMPEDLAMFYFYRGGYAQTAGHPDQARAFWERGDAIIPGSPCAYALGESQFAEGAYDLAESYNNKYLLEGRNPDYLASAQALALKITLKSETAK